MSFATAIAVLPFVVPVGFVMIIIMAIGFALGTWLNRGVIED